MGGKSGVMNWSEVEVCSQGWWGGEASWKQLSNDSPCDFIFLFCLLQSRDRCWGEVVSLALHSAFPFRQVYWRECSNPAFVSFLSFKKWGTNSLCLCFPQVCWHSQLQLGTAARRDHRGKGSGPFWWSGEEQAPGAGGCAAEQVQPDASSILCGVLGSGNTADSGTCTTVHHTLPSLP